MLTENQKEIMNFLKENLKIELKIKGGDYGSSTYINATLILKEEVISTTSEYLPL